MEVRLRTFSKSIDRSLSNMAVRHEAKEGQADALPQALNNRSRICWNTNTMRIVQGHEESSRRRIIRRSRKVTVGQTPGKEK
jgi:hypothetical protein